MPKSKQKKAVALSEFFKEDSFKIKENEVKAQPEIASPIIDPPVTVQPENAKLEMEKTTIIQPVAIPPKIKKAAIDQSLMMPEKSQQLNKDIWKKIIAGAILGILVVLSGTTFYFYRQWRQTKTNPQEIAKDTLSEIVAEVGNLIELPIDEEPTLATVTSVEKLKDQPFFAKAQNGDKALIYSQTGKAILYRPESHKIIEVISLVNSGQLANSQLSPNSQPSTTAPETAQTSVDTQASVAETPAEVQKIVNVVVYNGTNQKGLAKSLAAKLFVIPEIKVVQTDNAKGNFEKTSVIDLTGNNQALAQKIAETLVGEIGTLPDGEAKPEADILVIGGKE